MKKILSTTLVLLLIASTSFANLAMAFAKAETSDSMIQSFNIVNDNEGILKWSTKGLSLEKGHQETLFLGDKGMDFEDTLGMLKDIGSYELKHNTLTLILEKQVEPEDIQGGELVFKIKEQSKEVGAKENPLEGEGERPQEDRGEEGKTNKDHMPQRIQLNNGSAQITENIIDENSIKMLDKDGNIIDINSTIDVEDIKSLSMNWILKDDHSYVAGDYFEFRLPEQFKIYSEVKGNLDGYGTFNLKTDGTLRLTFNDSIEKESQIKGTLQFATEINKEKITTTEEIIEFQFTDEVSKEFLLQFRPTGGQAIAKSGQVADGQIYNTKEIQWTVDINTAKEELINAKIQDNIQPNQELILDSIELYEVEVDLQGKVLKEKPGNIIGEKHNSSTTEKVEIILNGDTPSNTAYRLKFRTKITDDEGTSYKNTADLTSDSKEKASSTATVSVKRHKPLEKTAGNYDPVSRKVQWTVKANYNEKSLEAGTEIVDEFTFKIGDKDLSNEVEIGSISILEINGFNGDGSEGGTIDATDKFDISIDGNKVTYKLKEDSNKAYKIIYNTTIKNTAYITDNGKITNHVSINGKTDTKGVTVPQQVGRKTSPGIDYATKTIKWKIEINQDSQVLNNFVLMDDFSGSGQILVPDSIKIIPAIDSTAIVVNDEEEGFTINFGDINRPYTVEYETKFSYDFGGTTLKPSFKNNVDISYTTTDGTDYELIVPGNRDPNIPTKNNGYKSGWYNHKDQEIEWSVGLNYNHLELDGAKLIDIIPENQSYIPNSLEIYEMAIQPGGGYDRGTKITDVDSILRTKSLETNRIELNFKPIDSGYIVVFKTEDKDGIYNKDEKYENNAEFIPRQGERHKLYANVHVPNEGNYVEKSGTINEDKWQIDWGIWINKSRSTLEDVEVSDDLGDEKLQIFLEDTIKVYETTVDDNGGITVDKSKVLQEGKDYTLEIGNNGFTLRFNEEIKDAYRIEYSSYILAEEDRTILKNDATFNSNKEIVGTTETSKDVEVRITTGGGTGQGELGTILIEKIDKNSNTPLENVAFALTTTVGNQEIVVREGTTDKDGKLKWEGLKYRDYQLKETIPQEYAGDEITEILLSKDHPNFKDGVLHIKVENERKTGTAKIIKVDSYTGKTIEGVTFQLTNIETNQSYEVVTDGLGIAEANVPFGEYTVEEIEAPEHYIPVDNIGNIVIQVGGTTEITVDNARMLGRAWIKKVDFYTKTALEGAKFEITSIENQQSYQVITNQEGIAEIDIPFGEYEVREIEAPENYLATENIGNILIKVGETTEVLVENQRQNAELSIIKRDQITKEPLEGVEFTLRFLESEDEDLQTLYHLKTNADGIALEEGKDTLSIPFGRYELIEVKTLEGYIPLEEPMKIEVKLGEENIFTVENILKNIDIHGTKHWKDDQEGDRPESIKVQLLKDGKRVGEIEVRSNEEGQWTYSFTDLNPYKDDNTGLAQYEIREGAVEGYIATYQGYDITNTKEPEDPIGGGDLPKDPKPEEPIGGGDLPKTATNAFNYLLLGAGLLGAGGLSSSYLKRKRKK